MNNHILLGKNIAAVYLADDKKAIRFDTLDGQQIIAKTDGDCCSETWIEGIDNPRALLGVVSEATDIDMSNLTPKNDYGNQEIQYYGFHIRTQNGDCTIDYRNESNGYYGGNLSWTGQESGYYGGVFGQNKSTENWVKITQ